jgi:basic membrane protein A and related proteins
MKRVDTSVYATIQQVLDGKFAGGTDSVFSIKNDGVALGKVSSKVPKKFVTQVRKISAQIANGTITNIPTEVPAS